MATTHVDTKTLPSQVQSALHAVGFRRRDIAVEPSETFHMPSAYGDGYRAFAVVLNMGTGERKGFSGSWGGANPFEPRSIDHDTAEHSIPINGCAILGQEGGGRPVSARLVVRPDQISKFLPAPAETTERERRILAIFDGIKAGPYRREELARVDASEAEIAGLVSRGFLKVASNGATSITTAGKNARGNAQVF